MTLILVGKGVLEDLTLKSVYCKHKKKSVGQLSSNDHNSHPYGFLVGKILPGLMNQISFKLSCILYPRTTSTVFCDVVHMTHKV